MFSLDVPIMAASATVAGCLARLTSFPFENARLEMNKKHGIFNTYGIMKQIVHQNGVRGLFKGSQSEMIKQMISSCICVGGYDAIKSNNIEYERDDPEGFNVTARLGTGLALGVTASVATVPRPKGSPLIKVKLDTVEAIDRYREALKRRNFDFTLKDHIRLIKNELKAYFRKMCLNGYITIAEVVSYDIIKDYLIVNHKFKDTMPAHFVSAILCGCVTAIATEPIYSVRKRYFSAQRGIYDSMKSCIFKMYRTGGVYEFYPRFTSNLARLIIFNITMWVTYEQLKRIYQKLNGSQSL